MASLAGVLPELATAYAQLANALASRGITIGVADYGGVRTAADTTRILAYRQQDYNAAVNAGQIDPAVTSLNEFRPIAPYGSSYHNYGAAFDVHVIGRPSSMSEQQALAIGAQLAPQFGLRWGGTFPDPDPWHFELAISLADAKQRYATMTGSGFPGASSGDVSSFLTPTLDDSGALVYGGDLASSLEPGMIIAAAIVAGVVLWLVRRS